MVQSGPPSELSHWIDAPTRSSMVLHTVFHFLVKASRTLIQLSGRFWRRKIVSSGVEAEAEARLSLLFGLMKEFLPSL